MVQEHRNEYPSEWAAITSIASKLGVGTEALRLWLRRAQIDDRQRPGLTSQERDRLNQLERENRELRRANEVLKAASAFFARELDRGCRGREIHQHASPLLGGRADLLGIAGRPIDVLRTARSEAVAERRHDEQQRSRSAEYTTTTSACTASRRCGASLIAKA
jgi:transposase-like protein